MKAKICQYCFELKDINLFAKHSRGHVINKCDSCRAEYQLAYQAKYREANRERIRLKDANRREKIRLNKPLKPVKAVTMTKDFVNMCAKRGCYNKRVTVKGIRSFCSNHALDIIK